MLTVSDLPLCLDPSLEGGGGYNQTSIDPSTLPLNGSCQPVYPNQYLRVNTMFEVRTAPEYSPCCTCTAERALALLQCMHESQRAPSPLTRLPWAGGQGQRYEHGLGRQASLLLLCHWPLR